MCALTGEKEGNIHNVYLRADMIKIYWETSKDGDMVTEISAEI